MRNTNVFYIHTAAAIGLEKAVILAELQNLIEVNDANKVDFYGGEAWARRKWLSERLPYISDRKFRSVLSEMINDGWIAVGYFSEDKFDRSQWLKITSKGYTAQR